jgi:hypothetical protein
MYEIEGLKIIKEGFDWVVSDEERSFKIDGNTLEPSSDWFCSYETIKRVISVLNADKQLSNE